MSMTRRAALALGLGAGLFALSAYAATPAQYPPMKITDVNAISEADLAKLPNISPAIAKDVIAKRPYRTVVDLNKVLTDDKLTPAQTKEFYGKAFVPINLNTGTKPEFLLIPGVGNRMSGEFEEYRPWKTWTQFDKEIGKYVGQPETDRLKMYFFIPAS